MPITRYPLETGEIDPINAKLLYVTHSIYENACRICTILLSFAILKRVRGII